MSQPKMVNYADEVARWLNLGPYMVVSWPMRIVATGEWMTEYGIQQKRWTGSPMSCRVRGLSRAAAEMAAASRNREEWEAAQLHNYTVSKGAPFGMCSGWLKRRGDKWVRDLKRNEKSLSYPVPREAKR